MGKYDDVLEKMGETQRWSPTTEIELVWNDRVLCVVDTQAHRVVVMVTSWMTELEVACRNGVTVDVNGGE